MVELNLAPSWNRWNPMREIRRAEREWNRRLRDLFGTRGGRKRRRVRGGWVPPVDVYEEDQRFVISAELPGVDPSLIDVSIKGNMLHVRGRRERPQDESNARYYRSEQHYGTFKRTFSLPRSVDTDRIAAEYCDGVLTLSLPKRAEAQAKRITIHSASGASAQAAAA